MVRGPLATGVTIVVVVLAAACSSTARSSASTPVPSSAVATVTAPASPTTTTIRFRPTQRPKLAHRIAFPVTAIGDSALLDAAPALRTAISGIVIDAAVSRSALPGPAIMAALGPELGRSVIFALGTNGGFSAALLDNVLRIANGRRVVLVTNHCPYCGWTPANNTIMRAGCTRARNCYVADWDALADRNPQWFGGGDGVHMAIGGAGAVAYAKLVRAQL